MIFTEITIAALTGAIIGAGLTFIAGIELLNRQRVIDTKVKFNAIFAHAKAQLLIISISSTNHIEDYDLFMANFPAQAAAFEELKPFILASDRRAYKEAWKTYKKTICEDGYILTREERWSSRTIADKEAVNQGDFSKNATIHLFDDIKRDINNLIVFANKKEMFWPFEKFINHILHHK